MGSSVVQPGAAWSERLSVSDVGMIVRDLFTGEKAGANTVVRSQGPMGIYEYSASALNSLLVRMVSVSLVCLKTGRFPVMNPRSLG